MGIQRGRLIELIEAGVISEDRIRQSLRVTGVMPGSRSWRMFLSNILLWLGCLALVFAVLFFIAYNWSDLGKFAKFGLVEGLVILAIAVYCKLDDGAVAGKMTLLAAMILLGTLLALYGQTYQTGADTWQLFFNWALLILPWVVIGRFAAGWIVWLLLLNISLVLYHQTFRPALWFLSGTDTGLLWLLFSLNICALAAWEWLPAKWSRLSERWAVRLLFSAGGTAITWLVLLGIFKHWEDGFAPLFAWLMWLTYLYFMYRKKTPDLFMLAGGCLSVITVAVTFPGEHIVQSGAPGGFLFLGLLVICMGTAAAFWLKNVHQEVQA